MKDYNPEMHTAEHIFNGTIDKLFGIGRSFTTHIEKKKTKIDFHFNRALTNEEIDKINKIVNEEIEKNHDVTEEFITRSEAEKQFNLTNLPEHAGDSIRIIKVGNYDSCPCIGPHVKNTSEIGEFRISTSDFSEGVLRIRFKLNRINN